MLRGAFREVPSGPDSGACQRCCLLPCSVMTFSLLLSPFSPFPPSFSLSCSSLLPSCSSLCCFLSVLPLLLSTSLFFCCSVLLPSLPFSASRRTMPHRCLAPSVRQGQRRLLSRARAQLQSSRQGTACGSRVKAQPSTLQHPTKTLKSKPQPSKYYYAHRLWAVRRNATVALVRNEPTGGFLRSSVDPLIKALQPRFQLVDSLAAGAWLAETPPKQLPGRNPACHLPRLLQARQGHEGPLQGLAAHTAARSGHADIPPWHGGVLVGSTRVSPGWQRCRALISCWLCRS